MIDVGQIIGILANVGVLAGIVFLAVELRQNTVAVRSEASQGVQGQITDIYSLLTTDRVADVYRRGTANPDQLDPTETVIFNSLLSQMLAGFENVFALVNEGSYDESRARGYWQLLRDMLEYPGFRRHWERRRFIYSEAFREHVENDVLKLERVDRSTVLSATN